MAADAPLLELLLLMRRGDAPDPCTALCRAIRDLVPVDDVVLSIGTPWWPVAIGATREHARSRVQYGITVGDGPTVEAFATAVPVLVPDVSTEPAGRWPLFRATVAEERARGEVLAIPLAAPGESGFAVMSCLSAPRRGFGARSEAAREIADAVARVVLLTEGADAYEATDAYEDIDEDLRRLITGVRVGREHRVARRTVADLHVAAGMVSVQINMPVTSALLRMRAHAVAEDVTLADIATAVIARRLSFDV